MSIERFIKDQMNYIKNYENIKFFICFPRKKLYNMLSIKDSIIVDLNGCNCNKENIDYLVVKRKTKNFILIKDVIEELDKQKYCPECKHVYLKDIKKGCPM